MYKGKVGGKSLHRKRVPEFSYYLIGKRGKELFKEERRSVHQESSTNVIQKRMATIREKGQDKNVRPAIGGAPVVGRRKKGAFDLGKI